MPNFCSSQLTEQWWIAIGSRRRGDRGGQPPGTVSPTNFGNTLDFRPCQLLIKRRKIRTRPPVTMRRNQTYDLFLAELCMGRHMRQAFRRDRCMYFAAVIRSPPPPGQAVANTRPAGPMQRPFPPLEARK